MSEDEFSEARSIPEPIRREVRQRCGFGCVICGGMMVDYDHMTPWSEVKEHKADNITLLCVDHHRQKNKRLLPDAVVRKANDMPFNLASAETCSQVMHFSGETCVIEIGGNNFKVDSQSSFAVICVDDLPIIWGRFEDGQLLLSMFLFDECNESVLRLIDNELRYKSDLWDITFEGPTLTMRSGAGVILMEIQFQPPQGFTISRGRILRNGLDLRVSGKGLAVMNSQGLLGNPNWYNNCPVAISFGERTPVSSPTAIRMSKVPRQFDVRAADEWYRKLQA